MSAETATRVGMLGGVRGATVDELGTVQPERGIWQLEWWIGGDDRWHVPRREAAVRQSLVEQMPVVRTAMRVPGGDAVHEVYGATADAVVIEVENASPAPFVVAFVVRGAGSVVLDDATVAVDGVPALVALRPPSRWATGVDGAVVDVVTSGGARDGPMEPVRDRAARIDAAFLYPVAHRTRLRIAVALGRNDTDGVTALDLTRIPPVDAVVRGWEAHLDRGMRVQLPDPPLDAAVRAARAQLLLAGQAWRADPDVLAALEGWGFDDEAITVWSRLGALARRRARRRSAGRATEPGASGGGWSALRAGLPPGGGCPEPVAGFLTALRDLLVREDGDAVVVVPEWPAEWKGLPVDVRDAPTRGGPVSFSVRWHGDRAALLWDAPPGSRVRAPGLDRAWASHAARGETLLAPTT